MPSIADLLRQEPPQNRPDTVPGFPYAAADSIFAALHGPRGAVMFDPSMPLGEMGRFTLSSQNIRLNPRDPDVHRDPAPTLAHEISHQETLQQSMQPRVRGLLNLIVPKLQGLDPEKQREIVTEEYGDIQNLEGVTDAIFGLGERSSEFHEILAETLEAGYNLARRADPEDPSKIREALRSEEERLPGTREAFNFFLQRFPR